MSTITKTEISAGTWQFDPTHSQVGFAVPYLVGTFRGSFSPVEATLTVSEDGGVELTGAAPVEGVKVQDENLQVHLLSPDFFDAERAPKIEFKGSDLNRAGNDVKIDGELTIKGITHPVELSGAVSDTIVDPYGNDRIGFTLETTIDRTQFDLNYNVALPSGEPALGNDVTLTAELLFVKPQAA
jgi:polyisoprenoid-binding protein YceI